MVSVNTIEELEFNYDMINKNTPLPDFSNFENIDKNIPETVASKFQEKYPNIWSKNRRARRPRMWFNYFQESLAFICEELKINDSDELYKMVCEYNKALKLQKPFLKPREAQGSIWDYCLIKMKIMDTSGHEESLNKNLEELLKNHPRLVRNGFLKS
jgi:hypothetical protein